MTYTTDGLQDKYDALDTDKTTEGIQSDKEKMEDLVNFLLSKIESKKDNIDDIKGTLLQDIDAFITSLSQDPAISKSLQQAKNNPNFAKDNRGTQAARDVQFITALKAIKQNLENGSLDLSSLVSGSTTGIENDFGKLAGQNYDKYGLDGKIGQKTQADIGSYWPDLINLASGYIEQGGSGNVEVSQNVINVINTIPDSAKQALVAGIMSNPEMQRFVIGKIAVLINQLQQGAPVLTEVQQALSVFGIDVSRVMGTLSVDQIKSFMTLALKVVAGDPNLNLQTELATLTTTLGFDVSTLATSFTPEKITEFMTKCPTLYGCMASSVLEVISSPSQLALRQAMIPTIQKIISENPQLLNIFDAMIVQMKPEETQKFLQVCMQDKALLALMNNQKILDILLTNEKLQQMFMRIVEKNSSLQNLFIKEAMKHPELFVMGIQNVNFSTLFAWGFNALQTGQFVPDISGLPKLFGNNYQTFIKQAFATLNADGLLMSKIMAAMTEEDTKTLLTTIMSPDMATARQEMMKIIIADTSIMNALASSTAVASAASDAFLAVMPTGTQNAINAYENGQYDKQNNLLGLSNLQLTKLERKSVDFGAGVVALQSEIMKQLSLPEVFDLASKAFENPVLAPFLEEQSNLFLQDQNFKSDIESIITNDLGLGVGFLASIEGGGVGGWVSALRKGALHKTGIKSLDMMDVMKKMCNNQQAQQKLENAIIEKFGTVEGFVAHLQTKLAKYNFEEKVRKQFQDILAKNDATSIKIKQEMVKFLPDVLAKIEDQNTFYQKVDAIVAGMSDEQIKNILNDILKPGNQVAGTLLPEFMGNETIMANVMTICMDPVLIKNVGAIAVANQKIQGYVARKILQNDNAITTVATAIHGLLQSGNLSLPQGQNIPDVNQLVNNFLTNGFDITKVLPTGVEIPSGVMSNMTGLIQKFLTDMNIDMTEVYELLTDQEKEALISVIMADNHQTERVNIMKAMIADRDIMNAIAGLSISLPTT